ncbi:uncharacterized protein TM35_000281120 [Trypanosoma theileri]|uniref:Uncharacterized protein n=1 Tax=Trypanosoma theileri TaxID=67003 RepID=A0A1X0NNU9_9TRYP|nr:uncharacterized protein TM35_000281120 [Trypanosoma theileri]ORC86396.1 hypothetical protein TM35_000281120 [Trypanosoma theileri]
MTALPTTDPTADVFNAINGFHSSRGGDTTGADAYNPSLDIQEDMSASNLTEQQQQQQQQQHGRTSDNNNNGDVGFDDFFFHNLPPISSQDEAAHASAFEGFCFDDICGDGGWPTTALVPNETSNDGNGPSTTDVTNGITEDHHNSTELFDFLLTNDTTGGTDASTAALTSMAHISSTRVEVDQTIPNFIGVELNGNPAITPAPISAFSPPSTNGMTTTTAATSFDGQKHSTVLETHERNTNAPSIPSTLNNMAGNHLPPNNVGNGHGVMCEETVSIQEPIKTIPTSPNLKSRGSLGVNDTSIASTAGSAGGAAAVSRVPREGVEELLRRAERILHEDVNNETKPTAGDTSTSGDHEGINPNNNNNSSNSNNPDSFFTAQVSHWLRRGAEVQENALSTVAELQLSLTQTMRLFGAHSGVSSALGPKYTATPVVLTLPLVVPMLQSLLEED